MMKLRLMFLAIVAVALIDQIETGAADDEKNVPNQVGYMVKECDAQFPNGNSEEERFESYFKTNLPELKKNGVVDPVLKWIMERKTVQIAGRAGTCVSSLLKAVTGKAFKNDKLVTEELRKICIALGGSQEACESYIKSGKK